MTTAASSSCIGMPCLPQRLRPTADSPWPVSSEHLPVNPKAPRSVVSDWCDQKRFHFEQVWVQFLDAWPRTNCPAGVNRFDLSTRKAEERTLILLESNGRRSDLLASFAFYVSAYRVEQQTIILPRQQLGDWLQCARATSRRSWTYCREEGIVQEIESSRRQGAQGQGIQVQRHRGHAFPSAAAEVATGCGAQFGTAAMSRFSQRSFP